MTIRLRIATFNLMTLDDRRDLLPGLEERIPILRLQLIRLDADILCLQEVYGQHERGKKIRLSALNRLLECTPYEGYRRVTTIDPATRGFRAPQPGHPQPLRDFGARPVSSRICPIAVLQEGHCSA